MSKLDGLNTALALAAGRLAAVDLPARARLLGLDADGAKVRLRAFGADLLLDIPTLALRRAADGKDAKPADRLLALHYLEQTAPPVPTGKLVSFRDFPGGLFYYQPFLSRTAAPLVKRFGDDLEQLRRNLGRFDWTPLPLGDLGATVHALGALQIAIVYRRGDDEFPPEADVLFDSCVKRAFQAEDAATLASRVCVGLL